MPLSRYVWVVLAIGCGAAPPPATEPAPAPEVVPVEVAASPPDPVTCTVRAATGPVPDLLLEGELPAPLPVPDRRHRRQRVIQLTEIDGYGPLHVFSADREGHVTDLGLGSDPRLLDDGSVAFLEHDWDQRTASFVRIASDGTITRTPGGNGRAGSLGGPAPRRLSPFTRDGRFMAWPSGEGDESHVDVFDGFPTSIEAPIEHLAVDPRPVYRLGLSEDGLRIGVCFEGVRSASVLDRTTRAWATIPFEGRCVAFAPDLDSLLVAPHEEGVTGLARISIPSGERHELHPTMQLGSVAYDPCGTSVVMTGGVDETIQRAERVFFDERPPHTLFEAPDEPATFIEIEIDDRGWVLVSSEDGLDAIETWVVPLSGGEVHHRTIDLGARIFGVTLGPAVP